MYFKKKLFKLRGTKVNMSCAYQPEMKGQTKTNRSLEVMLKMHVEKKKQQLYHKWLYFIQIA